MNKLAIVFPGQGTQYIGMGKEFFLNYKKAREVFEKANAYMDYDYCKQIFQGNSAFFDSGENTQLAIFITSVAMYEVYKESQKGLLCEYFAGHSLGEYTALYAGGVIDLNEGIELVRNRGKLMQKATLSNKGSMVAVVADNIHEITDTVSTMGFKDIFIANINSYNQIVYSGTEQAIGKLIKNLEGLEDFRTIKLEVSGAFHSQMMNSAAQEMKPILRHSNMKKTNANIIANIDAKVYSSVSEIREKLVKQIISPVQWVGTVNTMLEAEVDTILEIGPGKVLTGLNKKICRKGKSKIKCFSIRDVETLNTTLEEFKEM